MKRIFSFVLMVSTSSLIYAQSGVKKPVVKPAVKTVLAAPVLKTLTDSANYALGLNFANFCKQQGKKSINTTLVLKAIDDVFGKNKNDSASYALGLSFANFYKEQGITTVNKTLITKGMNDVLGNKKMLFDDAAANSVMNSYLTKMQQQKAQGAIDSGAAFLAKNKLKAGIKTTASGMQYEVITEGAGEKPLAVDSVTCHYKGTLLNGTVFDDSYSRGQPITFALNRVIAGWTEGLQLMGIGAKYKLYIPYTLGYGAFDYGPIPGGSMLTFEVELLNVKKPVVQTPAIQPPTGNNQ